MNEVIDRTYRITFDGKVVGTVDIADSGHMRWITSPEIGETAPEFTDKHMIMGCKENEWVDNIPFIKTRVDSAMKNHNDKKWEDSGTGVGFTLLSNSFTVHPSNNQNVLNMISDLAKENGENS